MQQNYMVCVVLFACATRMMGAKLIEDERSPAMTFLIIAGVTALTIGTVHTGRLVATDGLSRVPTRRS